MSNNLLRVRTSFGPVRYARLFAMRQHEGQTYGEAPYFVHLEHVGSLADDSDLIQMVAYLHDVLEDTDINKMDLFDTFGTRVCACVDLITDPENGPREVRKKVVNEMMENAGPFLHPALHVKAADRLANVRVCIENRDADLFEMYMDEYDDFRNAAYRPGVADDIWDHLDYLVCDCAGWGLIQDYE